MHVHYLVELVSGPSATKFFASLEIGITRYVYSHRKDKSRLLEHQMLLHFSFFPVAGTEMAFKKIKKEAIKMFLGILSFYVKIFF